MRNAAMLLTSKRMRLPTQIHYQGSRFAIMIYSEYCKFKSNRFHSGLYVEHTFPTKCIKLLFQDALKFSENTSAIDEFGQIALEANCSTV